MNKTFHSVWNAKKQAWVAAAETVSAKGQPTSGVKWVTATTALFGGLLFSGAHAQTAPPPSTLPTSGQVSAGQASISQSGANMVINQTSNRAAINWNTFNVGSNAQVQFNQPNASSVTLNRVLSSDPSQIFGRISANGQVILTNPSGVYFGPSARVDVGGLVATTLGMNDADFMAGSKRFERNGSTGSVVNEGELKAALGGYIALLAPEVRNQGAIIAQMGTVALASGEAIDLKFDSNNRLTSLRVEPNQIAALVENRHAVQAPDGLILISALSMDRLVGGVVKNSGSLEANSLTAKGGRIVLEANHIELQSGSRMDASGATGGGTVLVGGDWQGSGSLHQATSVTMAQGATIDASATQQGDGGKVVLWSDVSKPDSVTTAQGTVTAHGGALGGNGGQVETSGHSVNIDNFRVDTRSASDALGQTGLWLIDPYDYTIGSTEASAIANALLTSNVEVSTASNTAGYGSNGNNASIGGIWINANIASTTNKSLTLKADAGITQAAGVTVSTNGGAVTYWADADNNGSGAISFGSGAAITTNGGNITLAGGADSGSGSPGGYASQINALGAITLNTGGGNLLTKSNATGFNYSTYFASTATIDSGSGSITMEALQTGSIAALVFNGAVTMTSAKTSSAAISLTGNSSGTYGVLFNANSPASVVKSTAGGSILITGTGNAAFRGVYLDNVHILSASGPIVINAGTAGLEVDPFAQSVIGQEAGLLASSTSPVTITSDSLNLGTGTGLAIATAGQVRIQPYSTSFSSTLNTTRLSLDSSITGLTLGKSSNTANITVSNALNISGPLTVTGGALALNGDITTAGSQSYTGAVSASAARTLSGNGIAVNGSITSTNALTLQGGTGDVVLTGNVSVTGGAFSATAGASNKLILGQDLSTGAGRTLTATGGVSLSAGTTYLAGNITSTNAAVSVSGNLQLANFSSTPTTSPLTFDAGNASITLSGGTVSAYSGTAQGYATFTATALNGITGGSTTFTSANGTQSAGSTLTYGGSATMTISSAATYTGVTGITNSSASIVYTNNALPSTSGFTGAGKVTIEPVSSFSSALTTGSYTFANTLTGLTLGKTGNTQDITTSGAISIAGPITMTGGVIALNAGLSSTASSGSGISLTGTKLTQGPSISVSTQGANITYVVANSPFTSGVDNAMTLSNSATILANGGNVNLNASFASSGVAGGSDRAIAATTGMVTIETSGTGTISITGDGTNNTSTGAVWGMQMGANIKTVDGAITITGIGGKASGSGSNSRGIASTANGLNILSKSGAITLRDEEPQGLLGTATWNGLYLQPSSSNIRIGSDGTGAGTWGTSSSDITIQSNKIDFATNGALKTTIATSGNVVLEPIGDSFKMALSTTNLLLSNNPASVRLGKSGNTEAITLANSIAATGAIDVYGGLITQNAGVSVTTQGGSISYTANNVAQSSDRFFNLNGTGASPVTINANGGNVSLVGSYATGTSGLDHYGIYSSYANILTSGAGTITLTGNSGNSATTLMSYGMVLQYSRIQSDTGAITVTGTGSISSGKSTGISLYQSSILSNAGGISLVDATASGRTTGTHYGLMTAVSKVGADGSNVPTSTASITVQSDKLVSSTAGGNPELTVNTGGAVVVESVGTSFTNATLNTQFMPFNGTPSSVRIGRTTNTSNITVSSALNVAGPISIYGGNLSTSNLTATGSTITLQASGILSAGVVNAANLNLMLSGGNVSLTNNSNAVGTLAVSGAGFLTYVDSDALTIGQVGSTQGVGATGAISISTRTGDLTLAKNVSTTSTLDTALILNAGSTASSGTATGGNILVTGGATVSVGAGGRAQLMTGSLAGSTGLAESAASAGDGLVGYGSGRFRYNADETTDFTVAGRTALGSGVYAIYRESPATTISGSSSQTITYGNSVTLAGTASSLVNGDSLSLSLTGATYTAGSLNYRATPYSVTSNLANLGYTVSGSLGTVTVNRKALTITAPSIASKAYNASTAAGTVTVGTLSGLVGSETLSVTGSAAALSGANAGSYTTTVSYSLANGTGTAANYTLADTTGVAANITAKALSITAPSIASKVYDASTSAGSVTVGTLSGLVGSETLGVTGSAAALSSANAGNYTTTVSYSLADGTGLAANYTLANTSGVAASITAKALSITAPSIASKVYDASTTAGTLTLGTLSGLVGSETLGVTGSAAALSSANAGSYTTTVSYSLANGTGTAANYTLVDTTGVAASITAKALTVSGLSTADKVYDGTTTATVTGSATLQTAIAVGTGNASDGKPYSGDAVSLAGTAAADFSSSNVSGASPVNFSGLSLTGASAGNYTLTPHAANTTARITQAPLTVRVNDDAKFVVEADRSGFKGVSYSGFVNGETAAVLGGSATITRSNASTNVAGTYAGVLSATGLTSGNYSITYSPGSYTIVPSNQLLVEVTNASTTYGTAAQYAISSVKYENGGTVYVLGSGGVSGSSVSINSSNLVSINDGASGTASFTLTPLSGVMSHANMLAVGSYQLSPAGIVTANSANFSNTISVIGSHQVNTKGVTASASNVSKVYDGNTGMPGMTLGLSTLETNDVVTVSGNGAFADKNVGTGLNYTVSNLALAGADAGNYHLTGGVSLSGSNGAITAAPLTVTANNATKTYDGVAYSGGNGVSYSGFVGGESSSALGGALSYGGTSQGATNTGSYVITPSGLSSSNYNISYANGALTINPVVLTTISGVLQGTVSKVYDGTAVATLVPTNYLLTGWVGSDGATVTKTSGTYDNANTGSGKTVTVSLGASDYTATGSTNLSNYTLPTSISGAVGSITPAPIVVTVINGTLQGNVSKVYDGTNAATLLPANYALTGWSGADGATVTKTVGVYDNGNVGHGKTVTVSLGASDYSATGGTNLSNYTLPTSISGAVGSITRAPLTVTANDAVKTYDGAAYSGGNGVNYSGFVQGESASVLTGSLSYGGTSQGARNAGSYTIVPSGLGSANYSISYANGALDIAKANATVTANSTTLTYNGANQTVSGYTATGFVGGDTAAVLAGVSASRTGKDAGTYTVTATGTAANYNLTFVDGVMTIHRVPLTVTANDAGKTYDGAAYSGGNGVSYSGFVGGESASVLGGRLSYGGTSQGATNAGSYTIVPSGLSSANYSISYANGALTIYPAVTPPNNNALPVSVTSNTATLTLSEMPRANQSVATDTTSPSGAGVTVDLRTSGQQENMAMVAVSVPKGTSTTGTGFSFELPEAVKSMVTPETPLQITSLPAWLRFDSGGMRFEATAVPDSALPVQIQVTVAGQRLQVVISERTE